MSYWEDGTRRSTGNAFDTPTPEPETYQQRRNRLHREATAMRKAANKVMRVNRWIAPDTNKQASADKTAKLKGKP
jgi:uncharacterized protein (UPF0261 family)